MGKDARCLEGFGGARDILPAQKSGGRVPKGSGVEQFARSGMGDRGETKGKIKFLFKKNRVSSPFREQ